MAIEDYRKVTLRANHVNDRFDPVWCSAQDGAGRILRFVLTDANKPVDADGLTCRLVVSDGAGMYQTMAAVAGESTATFECVIAASSLSPGAHRAAIEITDANGDAVCTREFMLMVDEGIFADPDSEEMQGVVSDFERSILAAQATADSAAAAAAAAQTTATSANGKAVAAQATANKAYDGRVEYIEGTHTAVTAKWLGATQDSALHVGKVIAYKLPYTGVSGTTSTLELTLADGTTTGEVPVYMNGSTGLTTHYVANSVLILVYDGDGWKLYDYNTNTNYYDRRLHSNNVKAKTAVTKGHVMVGTEDGYRQLAQDVPCDLSYPILYANAAIAAGKTSAGAYEALNSINLSTSCTIGGSPALQKMAYLRLTPNMEVTAATTTGEFVTCDPVGEAGGNFFYVPLGVMYSATNCYFAPQPRLYVVRSNALWGLDLACALGIV